MYRFKCCRQNTRHLVQSPQIWRSKLCIACSNFLQKPWRVCTAAAFQLTEPLYLDFRWDSLHAKIPTETMDSVANGAIQYEHTCVSDIFTALGGAWRRSIGWYNTCRHHPILRLHAPCRAITRVSVWISCH